jgi:hypothetical protein
MKKNEDLIKEVQMIIRGEPLLNTTGNSINATLSRHLKKFVYIISLTGIGLFLNGCGVGYVATEPSFAEVSRPPRPSNLYIWIDGDWVWNNQSHVYMQKTGYWKAPKQNQIYVSGHWQASPKGKYWVTGQFQKQSRRGNSGHR